MRNRIIFAGALLVAALQPRGAHADQATDAEQMYQVGQAAFDNKQYDDAIAAWERSFALSNEPGLLFNIAQAYRLRGKPGDCTKATDAYKTFILRDASSDQRSAADGFVTEMKDCVAREAPTVPITATKITDSAPEPDEGVGRTKKISGLAIAGAGVALVATGFYYGHRASSLSDELTNACMNGCDWAVYSAKDADGHSAQTKQYVFGGLGVAAIVGGGVLYWLGSRERAPAPIAITSRRDGAVISWTGSW